MRIAIDATPAAVQRGGVGRYTRELVRALVANSREHRFILATAATNEQANRLLDGLSPGAWREIRRLPASERVMTAFWQRLRAPISIERWIGAHDVFHGPDFVLPPTRAATVVTIHDLSFVLHPEFAEPRLARYLAGALPRSIARADAVVAVSASVAAEVADLFPEARGKLVAIANGVRVPSSPLPRRAPVECPTILMVGTIEPRKDHRTALAAMKIVRSQIPEARLLIVGRTGWLAEDIESDIREAVDTGRVTWMSNADDEALEQAYADATVAISPSHYEGFGLTVVEALARGVPAVVSDIAAHREVAGGAAMFGAVGDPDELAAHLVAVIQDAAFAERLSESGRSKAAEFSWEETARRTLRVYESVGRRKQH